VYRKGRKATRASWRCALPLLLLLCLILLQQIPASLGQSATFDEIYKVSTGYAFLQTGQMRWTRDHPPLIRQLVALPLLLLHPAMLQDVGSKGEFAHRFFFDNAADPDAMLFLARLPVMAITLLLTAGIYAWAREMWGERAGRLAALVAALDPNLIAHGQLATNDVGLACFFFLAVYAFWRFLRRPSRLRMLVTGLMTGLALAAKFSAAVLVPLLAVMGFLHLTRARGRRQDGRRLLLWLFVICLIAASVLVVDYGEFRPVWDMAVEMQAFGQASIAPPNAGPVIDFLLTRLPVPAPSYWYGLWLVRNDVQEGRPVFVWGRHLETGRWYYFPLALLVKTPLAALMLTAVALVSLLRAGPTERYNALFLLVPAGVWLVVAMATRLNLGYRHVLPILPFLFVLLGRVALLLSKGWKRIALLALAGWLCVAATLAFPYQLAYFNELVGGSGQGYRYLVDSNLDWGQDLKRLARYLQQREVGTVSLAYFGTADPDYYGIEYECMPSYGLLSCDDAPTFRSGWLAVSATCLQGGCTEDPTAYRWLLDETPVAKIGYSIFIYHLQE